MKPAQRNNAVGLAAMAAVLVLVTSASAAFAFGVGTSATLAPPVPHVSKNGCTVAALPGLVDDEFSTGLKISPSGEYILGSPGYDLANYGHGLALWHDQQVSKLPKGLSVSFFGGGVNSSGTVAGGSYIDEFMGVVGADATEELDPPDLGDIAENLEAEQVQDIVAINDSGDVAGTAIATIPDEEPTMTEEAGPVGEDIQVTLGVLWPGGSRKPVRLESRNPLTHDTIVTALTGDGRVLGYATEYLGGDFEPWIWNSYGTGHALPRFPAGESGSAVPVDVAGDWVLSQGMEGGFAYRWQLSDPDDAEKLDKNLSVTSIDASGRVYGFKKGAPILLDDGEIVELPVLDDAHGGSQGQVLDASDDGGMLTGLIYPSELDGWEPPDPMRAVQWECDR